MSQRDAVRVFAYRYYKPVGHISRLGGPASRVQALYDGRGPISKLNARYGG